MSQATITAAFDDFNEWERQLSPVTAHKPTKAALRREGKEQILRGLGVRRHRSGEREAF
jgi:hypothetical protein